jgi:hypothetical protein
MVNVGNDGNVAQSAISIRHRGLDKSGKPGSVPLNCVESEKFLDFSMSCKNFPDYGRHLGTGPTTHVKLPYFYFFDNEIILK